MKIKFVSLSLSLLFSLPYLTFSVSAMDNIDYDIGETCSYENQHNEILHCHFHTDKGLTKPEKKEKKFIIEKINLYKSKDALNCLEKLCGNTQSSGIETLYPALDKNPFRLDQPSKISGGDNQDENKYNKINNKKQNKKNKYRNSVSSDNSTDSSSEESISRSSSISLDEKSKKDVIVIINIQKSSNTYCEVIVDRSVLSYFGLSLDSNNSKPLKIKLETIPKFPKDMTRNIISNWISEVKEWQTRNKSLLDVNDEKELNKFIEKYDVLRKGFKNNIKKDWEETLSQLSSEKKVNDLYLNNIDENKLNQFVDLIQKGLTTSLKNKHVMKIYFD